MEDDDIRSERMDPKVFIYDWRRDPGRPLRVVVDVDDVMFEELTGEDALGVQIWTPVDFDEKDERGFTVMNAEEWAQLAVLAVLRGAND